MNYRNFADLTHQFCVLFSKLLKLSKNPGLLSVTELVTLPLHWLVSKLSPLSALKD